MSDRILREEGKETHMTRRAIGAALLAAFLATSAAAQVPGPFLNIVPPGQNGLANSADAARFESTGQRPAHFDDQLAMYGDLVYAAPGLTDAQLLTYFKDAGFRVAAADIERTETPRAGVTIERDRFGVPHVMGETRSDVMFGAGYVTAEDRLFLTDVLRHVGRGRMSEFLGPSPANIAMDQSIYRVAGYTEAELQAQIDALPHKYGALGRQVVNDFTDFAAGMNQYINEALSDPNKMPSEYPALQLTPQPWVGTDTVAVATLIQATFAAGGGREQDSAILLKALQQRFGDAAGQGLWSDLRHEEDPEAPTTIDKPFVAARPRPVNPAAVAMPDLGSLRGRDPLSTMQQAMAAAGLGLPRAMSNFLAITGDHAAGGHPIAVMGPQTGYFAPQLLIELDLHGGGVDARGVAFCGISAYVLLGHTATFAWSATSGESDLVDVRAEKLCNSQGGPIDPDGMEYVYKGQCIPMYERTDQWVAKPSAGGEGAPTTVTAHVERSVHGPVFARATVNGAPVALSLQRSTFMAEPDSAIAFLLLNTTGKVRSAGGFQHAVGRVAGSFNWLYVSADHLSYYHSGLYPRRAPGVDTNFPSWGTGEWEWRRRPVSFGKHPRAVDPAKGWLTSWNNKPAPGWHAADSNFSYGPVYRSLSLDERVGPAVAAGVPITRAQMVEMMEDAGTVDLRGSQVLPYALQLIGSEPGLTAVLDKLHTWVVNGAHRRDRNHDGVYDETSAVAIMDEWYLRMIHAAFDPQLGGIYNLVPMTFDDSPSDCDPQCGVGSSYQDGYYGYLQRVFKMALGISAAPYSQLHCADGTAAGCRAALVQSLNDAVQALTTKFGSSNPDTWSADPSQDAVIQRAVGVVTVPAIHWINRPTFQQVVQITE
jgi:acyl-homoserine lactone acylase PvdQ